MERQSSSNSSSVNFDRKNSQNKSFRLAISDGYQREDKEEEEVSNNFAIVSIGVHVLRGSSHITPDQDNNDKIGEVDNEFNQGNFDCSSNDSLLSLQITWMIMKRLNLEKQLLYIGCHLLVYQKVQSR